MLNKFVNWLVMSSKNPGEVGLTVKSVLLGVIPTVMIVLNLAEIKVGAEDLSILVNSIVGIVQGALAIISTIGIGWGMLRKIIYTLRGENASI